MGVGFQSEVPARQTLGPGFLPGPHLDIIKKHGWNATSFQALEPGYAYWLDEAEDALVAYVDTGRAWVAAGAPIAAALRLAEVAARFTAAARACGRRACFFATERRFVDATSMPSMLVGEQPVWDPAGWDGTLRETRSLREQVRRARAKGVEVRTLTAAGLQREPALLRAMQALVTRWLGTRALAPMGFLVQLDLFGSAAERRFFVAERGGALVAALVSIPVYARNGWFLEDLLRTPAAPNGTADLLVDSAMRLAAREGARWVTLGLAPLAGPVPSWLRVARRVGAGLYDFEGLRAFKARLRPGGWDPIYLSYARRHHRLIAVADVLHAFARGGLLRFGMATLRRRPGR